MIFYYVENSKVHIADLDNKHNLIIDNNDDLDQYINRKGSEIWITYDQADYFKKVVTVYDCKDDYSIEYKVNSYGVKTKLEAVIETFFENIDTFKCKLALINEFSLPKYLLNSTIARITAYAIGGTPDIKNEFNFKVLDILFKYKDIKKFFDTNKSYNQKFRTKVAGVEHVYGYGGCHGARKGYVSTNKIAVIDVETFYPALLQKLGYFNIKNKSRAKYIHEQNIKLKGKPERLPYKLADNSIVGNFKNQYSELHNPRANNIICVNGQLLITALIEMLEPFCKLIQTNTDGIIVEYTDLDKIEDVCQRWERATGLNLGIERYRKIYQKDVNNYLLVGRKIKAVGELKECSGGNYTESIIRRSMRAYLLDKVHPVKTVNECNEKRDFQILAKPHYKVYANWYGRRIKNVFSYEVSEDFKFLDKQHYSDTAVRRLKKYGVTI